MKSKKEQETIYVAGPLTPVGKNGENKAIEYLKNARDLITESALLISYDFAVFCPALDMLYFLSSGAPISEKQIKKLGLTWLKKCDALYLPNSEWQLSKGTRDEVNLAKKLGIPIFDDWCRLMEHFGRKYV